jgi:hypothetical protein
MKDHWAGEKNSLSSKLNKLAATALPQVLVELSKIETFTDRIAFAEKHLEHLSSGSARLIYKTADGQVLKLAKNDRGIAQNRVEADPKMTSKFINPTTKSDKDGIWKLSPYCDKITEKEFEKLTGVPFKDFAAAVDHGINDEKKPNDFDKIAKSEIYKEIIRLNKTFKLLPGDMTRISSWGTDGKRPVLLDAGLTRGVYDRFYTTKEKTSG